MDDEEILSRGGTEEDIKDYAEANGANLTKEDFMTCCSKCLSNVSGFEWACINPSCPFCHSPKDELERADDIIGHNVSGLDSVSLKKDDGLERVLQGTPIKLYQETHYWLRKNYGKANKCENSNCKKLSSKFEWALVKGKKYEKNRKNFIQFCRQCHAKYDVTELTKEKARRTNIHTGKTTCLRGHPFFGFNLIFRLSPNGNKIRVCRTCKYIRAKKYRQTKLKK